MMFFHYHQKRPNDHTHSQGKEIDEEHNGKLQFKQYRQQKLSLSRGTNDFLKKHNGTADMGTKSKNCSK